jgi:hypothetical protein
MDPIIVTGLVSIVASVFGLIGVVIGGRISAAAAERAAKAAERQHFRELGMQFAMVNYEGCVKMAERAADAHNKTYVIPPLKAFVIQGIKIMEIVGDPTLSNQAMIRKISECEDFAKAIVNDTNQKYKNS